MRCIKGCLIREGEFFYVLRKMFFTENAIIESRDNREFFVFCRVHFVEFFSREILEFFSKEISNYKKRYSCLICQKNIEGVGFQVVKGILVDKNRDEWGIADNKFYEICKECFPIKIEQILNIKY